MLQSAKPPKDQESLHSQKSSWASACKAPEQLRIAGRSWLVIQNEKGFAGKAKSKPFLPSTIWKQFRSPANWLATKNPCNQLCRCFNWFFSLGICARDLSSSSPMRLPSKRKSRMRGQADHIEVGQDWNRFHWSWLILIPKFHQDVLWWKHGKVKRQVPRLSVKPSGTIGLRRDFFRNFFGKLQPTVEHVPQSCENYT